MAEQLTGQRPVILSVNAIVGGVFFPAGIELPFENEGALPESLKPFIATAEAPAPEPVQRNIYDLPLSTRRQVRGLEPAAAEKEWAEQQASEPLREGMWPRPLKTRTPPVSAAQRRSWNITRRWSTPLMPRSRPSRPNFSCDAAVNGEGFKTQNSSPAKPSS